MKCPICNSDNVNDAVFCGNCGASITTSPETAPQPDQSFGQMPPVYQPYGYMPPQFNSRDKKALMGMIFGIASLPVCCLSLSYSVSVAYFMLAICAALGIAGIVLSIAGLKSPKRRGMAIAGLVCGIVGAILAIACIALLIFGTYVKDSGLYDEIMNQYYNM